MSERFENYEVMRREDGTLFELGRGGMGVTYKAWDTDLHCHVALKVIHPNLLKTPGTHERFVREARAAARLRHPNIATVFRLGKTADDSLFYAMEFCEGPTLSQAVAQRGPFPANEALHVAWQVSKALVLAEQFQLLHRDLKPANLILSERPDEGLVVKVIDFGLAKCIDETQQSQVSLATGGFVGTAHFASPEQLEGGDLDIRSDLFALGGCLWYTLTGAPIFHGSLARVMSQTLNNEPPWEKLAGQPEPVVAICRSLLAKDRDLRPPTASAARQEMERVLHLLNTTLAHPEEESQTTYAGSRGYAFRSSVPPPPPSSPPIRLTPASQLPGASSLAGASAAPAPPPLRSVSPAGYAEPSRGGGVAAPVSDSSVPPPPPMRMVPESEFVPYRPPSSAPGSAPPGSVPPSGISPGSSYAGPLSSGVPYSVPISAPPRTEEADGARWGFWVLVTGVLGLLGLAVAAGLGWYWYNIGLKMAQSGDDQPGPKPRTVVVATPTPAPTPASTPAPRPTPLATPYATPYPTPPPTPYPTPRATPLSYNPATPYATPYVPRPTPRTFYLNSPSPWPGERDPETRLRPLVANEVRSWGEDHVRYAINEMYARHGAQFKDAQISRMFAGYPWYHPRPGVSAEQIEAEFTPTESENIKVLADARDHKLPSGGSKRR